MAKAVSQCFVPQRPRACVCPVMPGTQGGMMVTRCAERAHAAPSSKNPPTYMAGLVPAGASARRRRCLGRSGRGLVEANLIRELLQGFSDVALD